MDEVDFKVVEMPVEASGYCPICEGLIELQVFRRKAALRIVSGARLWAGALQCLVCGSLLRHYCSPELYARAWSDIEE